MGKFILLALPLLDVAGLSSEHLFISDMHVIVKYINSNSLTSSLTERLEL